MLLDMVMLSGGIDKSFSELLLSRGFQIRITPKGTLPFDTEASIPGASPIVGAPARSGRGRAGAVLGTSLYGRGGRLARHLFGYGIEPEAQALYQLDRRTPTSPRRTPPACCSARPRRACSGRPSVIASSWSGGSIRRSSTAAVGAAARGPRHGAVAVRLPRPAVGRHGSAGDAATRPAAVARSRLAASSSRRARTPPCPPSPPGCGATFPRSR